MPTDDEIAADDQQLRVEQEPRVGLAKLADSRSEPSEQTARMPFMTVIVTRNVRQAPGIAERTPVVSLEVTDGAPVGVLAEHESVAKTVAQPSAGRVENR